MMKCDFCEEYFGNWVLLEQHLNSLHREEVVGDKDEED